jgi:glycosyltransferase involved in cell wall biosynthesis
MPTLVTVYDMTTLVHPELFPRMDVWYWKHVQKRTFAQTAQVIAISQSTARDLQDFYGLPAERIRVIYPAIASHFAPASPQAIESVCQRYGLSQPYFIHIGRLDKKKNLPFLVQAFSLFRQKTGSDAKLVLVGEVYPKSQDHSLLPTIERLGLSRHVILTGKAPDQDLPALYSGAVAAVYPTLHEGFGLAQVEALGCGTTVIGHVAAAVVEGVGDAGILLATLDQELFADAMALVLTRPDLRAELRQRGLARARQFQGPLIAQQTLALYEEVAGLRAGPRPHPGATSR